MNKEQKEVRDAEWLSQFSEQISSGLTKKEFCKQKNIDLSKFIYYWHRLKKKESLSSPDFSPVKVIGKETPMSNDVRVSLPNGFQITLSCNLEPASIKKLIGALLAC